MKSSSAASKDIASQLSLLEAPNKDESWKMIYGIKFSLAEIDGNVALHFRTTRELYDGAISACRHAPFLRDLFITSAKHGHFQFQEGKRITFKAIETPGSLDDFPFHIAMFDPSVDEIAQISRKSKIINRIYYIA